MKLKPWQWGVVVVAVVLAFTWWRRRTPKLTSNVSTGEAVRPGEGVLPGDFGGMTV